MSTDEQPEAQDDILDAALVAAAILLASCGRDEPRPDRGAGTPPPEHEWPDRRGPQDAPQPGTGVPPRG